MSVKNVVMGIETMENEGKTLILLVESCRGKEYELSLPGGTVARWETRCHAVRREVREETGRLEIKVVRMVCSWEKPRKSQTGRKRFTAFEVKSLGHLHPVWVADGDKFIKPVWRSLEDVRRSPFLNKASRFAITTWLRFK